LHLKELCNALGIERNLSTAYDPQTDGQTEQINQEVEAYLRTFINYQQNNWSKWLPTTEFQYNNKVHSGTKHSPFFLNYGLHPWKGILSVNTSNPSANDFTSELIKVRNEAKTALQAYNGNMKDRGLDRRPKEKFIPRDSVWLEATNINSNQRSAKLDNKRYEPFEILEAVGERSFRLKLPETWAIHNAFHSTLLNRHSTPEFDSQKRPLPPPPDIVNDEEEYEVEEIHGHRKQGRGTQYLVHWKGYGDVEDSWLPRSALENSEEMLSKYRKDNNLD
jgi:hypothetical protein